MMALEYLKVIADSWPICFMVVGLSVCVVVRRSIRQSQIIAAEAQIMRAQSAVVVRESSGQ